MGGQNLNTLSLSQFTDLVDRNWSIYQKTVQTGNAKQMFITSNEMANTGDTRLFTEIDTQDFAKNKPQGEAARKTTVQQGYAKLVQAQRFAREIDITWEMRRYNKYPEITAQLTSLNKFCPNRDELDLTHRLTFAFATSYVDMDGVTQDITTGDGLSLANGAHTLKGSPKTYTNIITGNPKFSTGGLEMAETLHNTQILSQFGQRRVMDFNVIWTGDDPNTVNEVLRLLKSTTDIDQNNPSVVNVYNLGGPKYRHIKLPYLATDANENYDATKAKMWGTAVIGQGLNGWQAYYAVWEAPNLKTPAPGNNGEDVHTDTWTYGCRNSKGIAALSGRGITFSRGDGQP